MSPSRVLIKLDDAPWMSADYLGPVPGVHPTRYLVRTNRGMEFQLPPSALRFGRAMRLADDTCACGCLNPISGGATFRPGHDQRLKGNLANAVRLGDPIRLIRCTWVARDEVDEDQDDPWGYYRDGHETWLEPLEYARQVLSARGMAALDRAINRKG